ncbi:hypothetical protein KUCAC02_015073, partial [Chaenocephalus aceratus]
QHPAILPVFFPFFFSSLLLSPSVSCSTLFCSVRQDRIESHVVVIPGCKLAYDDDSLPYVAKVGVGRVEMLIKVLIYIKSSLGQECIASSPH